MYGYYVLQKELQQAESAEVPKSLHKETALWIRSEMESRWDQTSSKQARLLEQTAGDNAGLPQVTTVTQIVTQTDSTWKELDARKRGLAQIDGAPQDAQGLDLEIFLNIEKKYRLLREYTDIWTVYQIAWAQRKKMDLDLDLNGAPEIVNRIVADTYDVVFRQNLDCYAGQQLLSVFFQNEAFTRPSRLYPTTYVVIPRWALRHLWLGSAVAHEVGHNILWNVKGLYDGLLVQTGRSAYR